MSDEAWALRFLREDGVLVQPDYFFDLRLGATLVVSLLTPPNRGVATLIRKGQSVTSAAPQFRRTTTLETRCNRWSPCRSPRRSRRPRLGNCPTRR